MSPSKISFGLRFPRQIKFRVSRGGETAILYVRSHADNGAPRFSVRKKERSPDRIGARDEPFGERCAEDHGIAVCGGILGSESTPAHNANAQCGEVIRRDEAIADHAPGAFRKARLSGNLNRGQESSLHAS